MFKGIRFYNHGPHIHEYLQEFRRDVLANYDCMTIAEAPLVTPQRALDYIAESDTCLLYTSSLAPLPLT